MSDSYTKSAFKNVNQTAIIVKKYLDNGIVFILQLRDLHILEAKRNNNRLPEATWEGNEWS